MLHTLAGTFWATNPLSKPLVEARAELERQTILSLSELDACLNRDTAPLYNTTRVCKQNDLVLYHASSITCISDKLLLPDHIWLNNIDYQVKHNKIVFDEQENKELWLHDIKKDVGYIGIHSIHAGIYDDSSESYRQLLNIIYALRIKGATRRNLEKLILNRANSPYALQDEVVEVVTKDKHGILVITDSNVYRSDKQAKVAKDQKLKEGEQIFDICNFFYSDSLPPASMLPSLVVPASCFAHSVQADLTFENKEVEIVDNKFSILGPKEAINNFWKSLKIKLPSTKTINPCNFILTRCFNSAFMLVQSKNEVMDLPLINKFVPATSIFLLSI